MPSRRLAALLLCCATHGAAADLCPRTDRNAEWSTRCFQTTGAARKVEARFVNRLRSAPTTILIAETRELVAVDVHGRVIVPNIAYTGDFDMPNPDGIERFTSAGRRCGYFIGATFDIIVPAQFDHCEAFADGTAQACTGCVARCIDTDCHGKTMVGGQGVELDTSGRIRRRFAIGRHYSTPLPEPSTSTGAR
ncbi:hypothetical protein NX786_04385 [Telluria mixta]|uniref:WG repeat-containing protein n=1 Tax=Telluria mixta TaxID=34071 RepID=A0ABT2BTW5_9BURK|nr:hypothetical protein [Telluria mixta]MCS0628568.1 hypothetical protein [Telluria mixta]WEM93327.1 hypothetical protein P0M04_17610 [Telluria mixta]